MKASIAVSNNFLILISTNFAPDGWGTAFQWSADSPPKENDLRSHRAKSSRRSTKSTPVSPVRETHPLHWFVRDIDIGDTPLDTRSESGARYEFFLPKKRRNCKTKFIGQNILLSSAWHALAQPKVK